MIDYDPDYVGDLQWEDRQLERKEAAITLARARRDWDNWVQVLNEVEQQIADLNERAANIRDGLESRSDALDKAEARMQLLDEKGDE